MLIIAANTTHPSSTPSSVPPDMGGFSLVEFGPGGAGWQAHLPEQPHTISLPFALAAAAMGLGMPDPVKFDLIRVEIELLAHLLECPDDGPLRRRPAFADAPLHLKRLCSEAIGIAVTAYLAFARHGWSPALGWPRDLDVFPTGPGRRPDLLFQIPAGQVAGEARGRSDGRRAHTVTTKQDTRLDRLAAWAAAHNTKTFMAWAWATDTATRVDYFDPGEPRDVVSREVVLVRLQREAQALHQSARAFDLPSIDTPLGPITGQWVTPEGVELDVFVGVLDPQAVRFDEGAVAAAGGQQRARDRQGVIAGSSARVGSLVVAVRPRGSDDGVANLLDDRSPPPTVGVDKTELANMLERSEEELYAEIGNFLLPSVRRGFGPADVRRAVEAGRTWMTNALGELRERICSDPAVAAAGQVVESDPARLFLAITDALAAREGWPPPTTVAALVMKMGLDRLCR